MITPEDKHRQAITAAADLQDSMGELTNEIRNLRQYGKTNRRYIWGLLVSLVLDVALSVAVAVIAVEANNATSAANQARQSQQTTCESGNQARAVTVQLFNYMLDVAGGQPENQTPEKREKIQQFRVYLKTSYAPRDCSQIG